MPLAEQPESILYFYLTTPRVAAPRWYHEGIAVFVDTWMAGGIGRAQGGYDEMVFRADGARRRAASTIRSAWCRKAPKIDFQLADQLVPVRHTVHDVAGAPLLAREADRVDRRDATAAAPTTPRSSSHVFGVVDGRGLGRLDRRRAATSSERTSTAIRKYPDHAVSRRDRRARWARCRAPIYDPTHRARSTPRFNYPGVVAHVGAISTDDRRARAARRTSRAR